MINRLATLVILCLMMFTSCAPSAICEGSQASPVPEKTMSVTNISTVEKETLGVWIASVYNINFPSKPDLGTDALKSEMDSIIDNVKKLGLNTVFFQARPSDDALYDSDLFPVSKFLTSNGELYFDPLEYIIDKCHENNIELHVWLNPLRVTTKNTDSKEEALTLLDPKLGASATPELLVHYGDGKLYYNPGENAVRDIIVSCVEEILNKYSPDGIVFDDYFYPYPTNGADFDDYETYKKYGEGLSIDDWRRQNVNTLIKNVYTKIKEINANCNFGVSPFGIWQNNNGENQGSDTTGLEAYSVLYCDALTWAREGYVDYLSPQLYWESESESASFITLCEWWNSKLDGTNCDFIPSLASYRYDNDWDNPRGEMTDQISLGREMLTYRGVVYYGYEALKNNVNNVATEIKAATSVQYNYYKFKNDTNKLEIISHKDGVISETDTIIISGMSSSKAPLTLNGKNISRGIGGKFEVEVSLSTGKNVLEFKNGDYVKNISIYKMNK